VACALNARRTQFCSFRDIERTHFWAKITLPMAAILNTAQRLTAPESGLRRSTKSTAKIRALTKFVGTAACSTHAIRASRDADRGVEKSFRALSRNRTQTVGIFPQLDVDARTKKKMPAACRTRMRHCLSVPRRLTHRA